MKTVAQSHEEIETAFACERVPENPPTAKAQWVQHHADNMFRLWLSWRTPLGIAHDYVEHLKRNLSALYEDPLKRTLIEATYGSRMQ